MPFLLIGTIQTSISGREKKTEKNDASSSVSWEQPREINQQERNKYVLISYLLQAPAHSLSYLILTTVWEGNHYYYFYFAYQDSSSERLSDLLKVAEFIRDEAEVQTKTHLQLAPVSCLTETLDTKVKEGRAMTTSLIQRTKCPWILASHWCRILNAHCPSCTSICLIDNIFCIYEFWKYLKCQPRFSMMLESRTQNFRVWCERSAGHLTHEVLSSAEAMLMLTGVRTGPYWASRIHRELKRDRTGAAEGSLRDLSAIP